MDFNEIGAIIAEKTGLKICPICGTPFTPYHLRQKTCGQEECKKENHKEYMRNRINGADAETAEKWRIKHREANKRYYNKQRKIKERDEQLSEIIEQTQKQIDFDNYIKKHGHEYGKKQIEKTLALVPKIDVNIETKKEE